MNPMKYDEGLAATAPPNTTSGKKFGTDQVIPLWIADMDFKTAQPIVDALTARAQEGIWGHTSRPDLILRPSRLAEAPQRLGH